MSNSAGRATYSYTPHLLGIVLAITTPNGPQFVFNYPQTAHDVLSHTGKSMPETSRPGRKTRPRNQDPSQSLDSMPPSSASKLYRFESPDTSPASSVYQSSDNYTSSSSESEVGSSGDVSEGDLGGDGDIFEDEFDLELDEPSGFDDRRHRSNSARRRTLVSLSQTLAHGVGDPIHGVGLSPQHHTSRRSRRRRKHVSGSGFLPRHRSHTPNRPTNLSNSVTLGEAEDDDQAVSLPPPVSHLTAELSRASQSSTTRQVISPSSAVISSPRLSSTIDTSMITSTINLDDITNSLRLANTGVSSRSTSQTRGLSRRGSIDVAPSPQGPHHYHRHQRKASAGKTALSEEGEDERSKSNEYGADASRGSHSIAAPLPWEKTFGYDDDFLAALLCPRRSMCDTKFEFTIGDLAFLGLPMHVRQDGKWKRTARERMRRWRRRPPGSMTASATMKSQTSESDRFDGVFGYDETAEGDGYEDDEYYDEDGEGESSTNALERSLLSLNMESSQGSLQPTDTGLEKASEEDGVDEMTQSLAELGTSLSNNINNMFHAFQSKGASAASTTGANSDSNVDRFSSEAGDDGSGRIPSGGPSSRAASRSTSVAPSPLLEGLQQSRKSSESKEDENSMYMFNVVFVMSPPELEYNVRIDEMYDYVAAPLAECLRYEQHKSAYVWKQAQMMLRLRERATVSGMSQHELWAMTLTKSSLALALAQIYLAISTSSIANVVINNITRSFQIPIQMHSAAVPSILEPVKTPGFYLTTEEYSDRIGGNGDGVEETGMPFLEHALLLLDDPDKIITVIQSDPRSPLARFIRSVSPAETLVKVAAATDLSIDDCESFARHLIYWRRARLITPIHRRGIYIVAPTAPLSNLHIHSKIFAKAFPKLPSLPRLLQEISCHEPRPYGSLIPSHAMRERYLEGLAWLLRLGYLAQLRTFIWLRISGSIKKSVAQDELIGKALASANADSDDEDDDGYDIVFEGTSRTSRQRLFSMNAMIQSGHDLEDSILLEPGRANVVERKWMDKIIAGKNDRLIELFWKLTKYMNGHVAFEDVPAKEGIERREVRNLLAVIKEHIIISRHW